MEGWRGEGFVILLHWNNYLSVSFEKLGPFPGQTSTSAGPFRRKEALKADFQNIIQRKNKTYFLVSWNLLELLLYSPFFYIKQILPETHNLLLHRTCNFFTLPGGHSWGLLTDAAEILMGAEFIDLFYVALWRFYPPGMFEIPTTEMMAFIFNLHAILGLSMFDRHLFLHNCNVAWWLFETWLVFNC